MTSYKVEFLSTALSVNGSAQWVSNSFRYRTRVEAADHFSYLRGKGAPPIETRIVPTEDEVNCIRRGAMWCL